MRFVPEFSTAASLSRRHALRNLALATGAAAIPGWLGRGLGAAEPASEVQPLQATVLREGVTHVTGGGFNCNILVVAGPDGGVVVDSGIADAATATAAHIARIAPRLALLVNTHWHFDHVGGNERLAKAGARIVAHANVRARMSSAQKIEAFGKEIPASPVGALPVITVTEKTTLHLNSEDLRLIPVPPAHTDGDVIVRLEKANVLHLGDLFFHGFYPFIDYSSGGWIGGMAAAVKSAISLTDANTKVIPGHGAVTDAAGLREYLAFLETATERLTKLKTAGKTVEEVVAAAPFKDYDEKLGGGFLKPEQFVAIAYTGLLKNGG